MNGERSDEHVWAEWLRKTSGAELLLQGTRGERIPKPSRSVYRDASGRYELASEPTGRYAKWLPHVVVSVCSDCNNGWMSKLENAAKRLLGPLFFEGSRFVRLSNDNLTSLATWVTKSWMAYALTLDEQSNPFTVAEYRAMARNPAPLDRSAIWMFYSEHPRAHVGMGLLPILLHSMFDQPDFLADRDNAAFGFLATSGTVFFLRLFPADYPSNAAEVFVPDQFASGGVRKIWPNPRRQFFPLDTVTDNDFDAILEFPTAVIEAITLPVEGLNDTDVADILAQYRAGSMPSELRKRWDRSADKS
jgi:hypothetical protein